MAVALRATPDTAIPTRFNVPPTSAVRMVRLTSLAWHEVGPSVGSVRNEGQALILPIEEPPQGGLTL